LNRVERWGTGLSLLCAIHCAAMPLVLGVLPFLGSRLGESHWLEALLVGAAAVIGYTTLGTSFRRHGQPLPLLSLTLGLALVALGHLAVLHHAQTTVAVMGGLTLAGAQILNRRITGACHCDHHSSPHESDATPLAVGGSAER
jgi:hypothetical protein